MHQTTPLALRSFHQAEKKEPVLQGGNERSLYQFEVIAEESNGTNLNQIRRNPDISNYPLI
jgi:hypothetical protein